MGSLYQNKLQHGHYHCQGLRPFVFWLFCKRHNKSEVLWVLLTGK